MNELTTSQAGGKNAMPRIGFRRKKNQTFRNIITFLYHPYEGLAGVHLFCLSTPSYHQNSNGINGTNE